MDSKVKQNLPSFCLLSIYSNRCLLGGDENMDSEMLGVRLTVYFAIYVVEINTSL